MSFILVDNKVLTLNFTQPDKSKRKHICFAGEIPIGIIMHNKNSSAWDTMFMSINKELIPLDGFKSKAAAAIALGTMYQLSRTPYEVYK